MKLENCGILHADSMDILPRLEPGSFDALITDPPYSSGGMYRGDRARSTGEKYIKSDANPEYASHDFDGDNMDQRAWTSWCAHWLAKCKRAVKPGGVAAVFVDWRQVAALYDAIQWAGWTLRGLLAWSKPNARPQPARPRQQCEFIVWASNGPLSVKRNAPYLPGMFTHQSPASASRVHQTEKPLELMREIVHICESGGRILDPFAGSGTTVCAAYLEGYTALGVECNAYYVKAAQDRLSQTMRQTII